VIHIDDEIIRRVLADASTKGFALYKRNLYTILRERKTIFILAMLLLPTLLSVFWTVSLRFDDDTLETELRDTELGNVVTLDTGLPETFFINVDAVFPASLSNQQGDRDVDVFVNATVQNQSFSSGPFLIKAGRSRSIELTIPTSSLVHGTHEVLVYTEINGTEYTVAQLMTDINASDYSYYEVLEKGPETLEWLEREEEFNLPLGLSDRPEITRLAELYNATEPKSDAISFSFVNVLNNTDTIKDQLERNTVTRELSFQYENTSREMVIRMPRTLTFDRDTRVKGWIRDNSSSPWIFLIKVFAGSRQILSSSRLDSGEDGVFNITLPEQEFPNEYRSYDLSIYYILERSDGSLETDFNKDARYRVVTIPGVAAVSSTLNFTPDYEDLLFTMEQDASFSFTWERDIIKGVPSQFKAMGAFKVGHGQDGPTRLELSVDGKEILNHIFQADAVKTVSLDHIFQLEDFPAGSSQLNITLRNGFLEEVKNLSNVITISEGHAVYELVSVTNLSLRARYGINLAAVLELPEVLSTREDERLTVRLRNDGLVTHNVEIVLNVQEREFKTHATVNASETRDVELEVITSLLKREDDSKAVVILVIRKTYPNEEHGRSTDKQENWSRSFAQGLGGFNPDDFQGLFDEDEGDQIDRWEDDEFIYIARGQEIQVVNSEKDTHEALALFVTLFTELYLLFLILIVCMVYGSMMIKDEVENKTMHLLLTSPMTKFEIVVYKYLAYVSGVFLLLAIPIVTNYIILTAHLGTGEALLSMVVLTNILFITFLAVACYGTIFMLLGNIPKNPVLWGLTYAIFWEGFITRAPLFIQYFTVNHYIRSAMLPLMEDYVVKSKEILLLLSFDGSSSLATPQLTAYFYLVLIPFVMLFVNMAFLKYRDFS
jgi:ABC-type transport system involved in multi-copper enzyme maturation permease subunit